MRPRNAPLAPHLLQARRRRRRRAAGRASPASRRSSRRRAWPRSAPWGANRPTRARARRSSRLPRGMAAPWAKRRPRRRRLSPRRPFQVRRRCAFEKSRWRGRKHRSPRGRCRCRRRRLRGLRRISRRARRHNISWAPAPPSGGEELQDNRLPRQAPPRAHIRTTTPSHTPENPKLPRRAARRKPGRPCLKLGMLPAVHHPNGHHRVFRRRLLLLSVAVLVNAHHQGSPHHPR